MRRAADAARRWLVVCGLLLAAVEAAAAQAPPVITGVRVEQEGLEIVDPEILRLIETAVGEPLSTQEVKESEAHLMGLNRYEGLEVITESAPGGVRLVYRLFPLHPVDRVEFRGRLGIGEGDLQRAVRDRFGAAPPAGRIGDVRELLLQVYRDHGYPNATVTAEIVPRHDPDRATLVVTADAGRRALVTRVDWDEQDEPAPGTFVGRPDVRANRPYDLAEIRRTLDRYIETMRKNGFYEALAEPATTFEPDGAVVRITLRRGPRVRVLFAGDPIPKSEQERLVPVRAEASVVDDLLENWELAIEDYLRGLGYHDVDVQTLRATEGGELTITFEITRGPRYVLSSVALTGNMALSETELRAVLGVKPGEPFVEVRLDSGAAVIEDLYLGRGFQGAQVKPEYTVIPPERPSDARRVEATIAVTEGPRTIVGSLAFSGNTVLSESELRDLVTLTEGAPLSPNELLRSRDSVEQEYRNRGFENIAIRPQVALKAGDTAGETRADILIAMSEGPQILVDRVIIDGNERTSRQTIERELKIGPGDPVGEQALAESRAGLIGLGLFRRVRIDQRRHVGETRRDLLVRVEEAPPTTLGYGGGLEVSSRLRPIGEGGAAEERLELVPRAFFEIGRRNMWGKNRSVNLFTRVSARARDTVSDAGLVDSSYGVNEYRLYGTFREPKMFGGPATVLISGISERAIRTSYSFVTREGRAEMGGRLSRLYSGGLGFSIQKTQLFDVDPNLTEEEKPLIDRVFPQVRLSKISGSLIRNSRDNDANPSRGTFISTDGALATRGIGSEVGFVKMFVQASWYRQLPSVRRIVLALRGVLGAAHGFPREVPALDEAGNPIVAGDGTPLMQTVQDLPAGERFFAGGSTTNRGFTLDRLGQPDTISPGGFPTGGNGEILLNSEVRVDLFKGVAAVGFVDAGNVFKRAADASLGDLRPAVGFGVHYQSFVGPVRVEIGFNPDRRELSPGRRERGYVVHVSLGPAF